MTDPTRPCEDHPFDKLILAVLKANSDRPTGLPLESEEELDAYVMGVEQGARLLAAYLGSPQRADFWIGGKGNPE